MQSCNGETSTENITLWYDEITSEYGIATKVKHIVTDNASNVRKAFLTLPGFEKDLREDIDEDDEDDMK